MEVIKKIVNLDKLKSRTPALVPYIKIGSDYKAPVLAADVNGDLGGIMCNLRQLDKNTADLFNSYYKIKNILRTGTKAMRVVKNVDGEEEIHYVERIKGYVRSYEFVPKNETLFSPVQKGLLTQTIPDENGEYADEEYIRLISDENYKEYLRLGGQDTVSTVEELIGLVKVPSDITGSRVPEMFYMSQIEPWLYWFERNKGYKYSTITKKAYDDASPSEKGTMTGDLPKKVLAEHPKYLKLTTTMTIGENTVTQDFYYMKVVGEPNDCCVLDEWNDRGGLKMLSFLLSKSGVYRDKLRLWQERLDNGDILVPTLSIPILLTQNYDDNGAMSVYDESIGFNSNEAGDRQPYTEGVKAESKLMTLRTRERLYDDSGEILPYIGNGQIPFKLNECKNMAFDEKNKCYIGDYIRDIKYFDEEGNTSSTITDGFVEFEYVIGGVYDTTKSKTIKVEQVNNAGRTSPCGVIELSSGNHSINLKVSLNGASGWVLVSNTSGGWLRVNQTSGSSGNVTVNIGVNGKEQARYGTLVFGTNSRTNYEEVYVSFMQAAHVAQTKGAVTSNMTRLWFNWDAGLTATTIFNGEMIMKELPGLVFEGHVTSSGSDWYVKSKPSFINLSETGGKDGHPVVFRVACDKQKDAGAPIRTGEIVLAITDDSNVTFSIEIMQISGQMYGNGLSLGQSTVSLGTGSTASKSVSISFVGQCDRQVTSDVYRFVAVEGDPSYVLITKNTNRFTLTNNNYTNKTQYITFHVYSNLIEDSTIYDTLMVTLEPLVTVQPVSIMVTSTAQTVNYNKTVVYDVSVNDPSGQRNAWHVETSVEGNDGLEIRKISNARFSIKNLYEGTGVQKRIAVWAVYDFNGASVKSNEVPLTLVPPMNLAVEPELHISQNYTSFVQLEIWPKSEDPVYAAVITTDDAVQGSPQAPNGDIMQEVIDGGSIHRDPNDRYCIRLTNPRYGYQSVTHATILDRIGKVVWQNAMQYDQIYEFDGSRLITDMLFQIKIYIEP